MPARGYGIDSVAGTGHRRGLEPAGDAMSADPASIINDPKIVIPGLVPMGAKISFKRLSVARPTSPNPLPPKGRRGLSFSPSPPFRGERVGVRWVPLAIDASGLILAPTGLVPGIHVGKLPLPSKANVSA